jgi:hypothetical protein
MSPNQKMAKDRREGERKIGKPRPLTVRRCGRPTKDGAGCARQLEWYEFACSNHATQAEQDAALDLLRAAEQRAGR